MATKKETAILVGDQDLCRKTKQYLEKRIQEEMFNVKSPFSIFPRKLRQHKSEPRHDYEPAPNSGPIKKDYDEFDEQFYVMCKGGKEVAFFLGHNKTVSTTNKYRLVRLKKNGAPADELHIIAVEGQVPFIQSNKGNRPGKVKTLVPDKDARLDNFLESLFLPY